jgi:hypothetical protein
MNPVHEIPLPGLDGANPLGFLAALGTWRTTEAILPGTRMYWKPLGGHWAPSLRAQKQHSEEELACALHTELRKMKDHPVFTFANNLKLTPAEFSAEAEEALKRFFEGYDLASVAFLAAFGSSITTNDQGDIEDTGLRTMSGAGHQHFVKTMNDLARITTAEQIHEALFDAWTYPDEKVGLRWDPGEDKRYALAWKNPSTDATMTQRGANRLAIEALPLLSTAPVSSHLETTGFSGHKSNNTFFTWPIWDAPVSLDTGRSLLALIELQSEAPDPAILDARGICAAYRSQRITTGKFRNFTPPVAIA